MNEPENNETDDQRNDRLKAEFYARPAAAELEKKFNLEYGGKPIQPSDLTPPPEAELDPDLQALKQKFESLAGKQAGSEVEQAGHDNPLGEIGATEIEVTENFREEMGDEYDEFIQAGARGLKSLFPNLALAGAAIRRSGILDDADDLDRAMRLLARIGAKARR